MPYGISSVGSVFTAGRVIRADHGPHGVVWFGQAGINEYRHLRDGVDAGPKPIDREAIERSVEKAEAVETVPAADSPFEGTEVDG